MLARLIKHEFRATGQVMLPLYLVVLLTAVGANAATRGMFDADFWFFRLLASLLLIAFFIAIFCVCGVSFVLMIQRFYKNLLQDEGYVMLTLPVSVHQHLWSKLIVSAVWFVLTLVVVFLAVCIMAFNIGVIRDILEGCRELLEELREIGAVYAVNGAAFLAELALLCFLGLAAMCVQFYAALAAGHSAPNHKMVYSIGAFFAMQFLMQLTIGCIAAGIDTMDIIGLLPSFRVHGMAGIHLGMLVVNCLTVVYGAIFYFITVYFLKRRLNLE